MCLYVQPYPLLIQHQLPLKPPRPLEISKFASASLSSLRHLTGWPSLPILKATIPTRQIAPGSSLLQPISASRSNSSPSGPKIGTLSPSTTGLMPSSTSSTRHRDSSIRPSQDSQPGTLPLSPSTLWQRIPSPRPQDSLQLHMARKVDSASQSIYFVCR